MKDRIGIAIRVVSLLISCLLVAAGCMSFPIGYFILDWGSAVMEPRFCLYRDRDFQEPLGIGEITVWKVRHSFDEKKRWKFDVPWEIGAIAWRGGWKVVEKWAGGQTVWQLEYKFSDNLMKRLLTPPIACLTYGEVPPGYQEKVNPFPLEPEAFYGVWIRGYEGALSNNIYFIIRLDATGIPERLEYHQQSFLITNPSYFIQPRDDLKLY